ncbi:MAG: hypothetical protein LBN36_04585 [Clostridiales Family XIII bacterium]|jgi:bifunctional DNA-binding transcriptional regulator/antitoxin component of YhaV-PrlF toxin-antitoxin module|nr:hypothetical protein [Clostridiales Family XIII bacterium]
MAEHILISVPKEDFDTLGITEDTIVEMFVNDNNEFVIRRVDDPDDGVFPDEPKGGAVICVHAMVSSGRTYVGQKPLEYARKGCPAGKEVS